MVMTHHPLRVAPAWWLVVVSTLLCLYFAWYVYDWLSAPDPWSLLASRGARGRVFRVMAPILLVASLLEMRWAWVGSAVAVNAEGETLRCRKHIGAGLCIPFGEVKGLRVHRHHIGHGITILSPRNPPTIPIRLPRGTDPTTIERELRIAVGLDP